MPERPEEIEPGQIWLDREGRCTQSNGMATYITLAGNRKSTTDPYEWLVAGPFWRMEGLGWGGTRTATFWSADFEHLEFVGLLPGGHELKRGK